MFFDTLKDNICCYRVDNSHDSLYGVLKYLCIDVNSGRVPVVIIDDSNYIEETDIVLVPILEELTDMDSLSHLEKFFMRGRKMVLDHIMVKGTTYYIGGGIILNSSFETIYAVECDYDLSKVNKTGDRVIYHISPEVFGSDGPIEKYIKSNIKNFANIEACEVFMFGNRFHNKMKAVVEISPVKYETTHIMKPSVELSTDRNLIKNCFENSCLIS